MPRRLPSLAPERATERVELKLTKTQMALWDRLATERGMTIKGLVVVAVEAYATLNEEKELAGLGREVMRLVEKRRRS